MADNRVIRFADKDTAYGFVAELRRLYDLGRWQDLWVHVTDDGILVEMPVQEWAALPLADLAKRYGGWAPAGGADLEMLRARIDAANRARLGTQATLDRSWDTVAHAKDVIERSKRRRYAVQRDPEDSGREPPR